jgi:hypothetical protein
VIGAVDMDIRQYLVMLGYLGPPTDAAITRGYFEAGAGWADHVASASASGESGSDTLGRMVFVAQGGLFLPFGRSKMGLDLSIHVLGKLIGKSDQEEAGFIFGGQAGFVVFLGGD